MSNAWRVLALLSLAFLLVSMSTDANAARRSALGGNQFIDDSKDMYAFPQLLLKYNNTAIFDFAPSASYLDGPMTARGSVTFGDNWAWQVNTGRADFLENTAFWAWGGFDRQLDLFAFGDVQWWDVGVATTFGEIPVGFNFSLAVDSDKTTPEGADPTTDYSESMLSFQLGADLLNANWAFEVGFGSETNNIVPDEQADASFFELAIAARGNTFEAGGLDWRWLAAFATFSEDPKADDIESDTMMGFRGNFGPVWGTPGDWLVGAYIYFEYFDLQEANAAAANAKDTYTAITIPGYNFAMEYYITSWLAARASVFSHYAIVTEKTEGTAANDGEIKSRFYNIFWTVGLGLDKGTWGLDVALEEDQFHSGYVLSNSNNVGDAFALVTAWLRW